MKGKKGTHSQLTRGETRGGLILFPIYVFLLPALFAFLADYLRQTFHFSLDASTVNVSYYCLAALLVFIIFRKFLISGVGRLFQRPLRALMGVVVGLVFHFGIGVLISPITSTVENLNNEQMIYQAAQAPWMMFVMTVILAPIVEETLFRGLIFGLLRRNSRLLAYLVSTFLFCLLHVWQQVFGTWDIWALTGMLSYVAPSLALAFCYETSDSIWAPILLHAIINAIAMGAVVL